MSPSAETRAKLDAWFAQSDYSDVKFWLSPNALTSLEGCEAELWASIQDFEQRKRDGTLKLTPAEEVVL